ncbi:hypothetical protein [Nocardia tengchongensis]|uniref:hypothetical protein n=1 Tax=Nocardia tengchongensis TaxID=2055889 RepID=UPI0036C6AABD
MSYPHFETTDQGYLPAGTDVLAVVSGGDERALQAAWSTYHHRQFLREVVARAGRGDTEAEQQRSANALPEFLAELDSLAEVTALQALTANRRMVDLLTGRRWTLMRDARESGESWAAIGAALGMSKQGALDWYKRKIAEQEKHVGKTHDADRARAVVTD